MGRDALNTTISCFKPFQDGEASSSVLSHREIVVPAGQALDTNWHDYSLWVLEVDSPQKKAFEERVKILTSCPRSSSAVYRFLVEVTTPLVVTVNKSVVINIFIKIKTSLLIKLY